MHRPGKKIIWNLTLLRSVVILILFFYSSLQLLTPHRDYGNLTNRQRNHNYTLSRCRATLERAFALLKGKWRRLKNFPHECLDYMLDTIMASVVVHNFIILEGEEYEVNQAPFLPCTSQLLPLFVTCVCICGRWKRTSQFLRMYMLILMCFWSKDRDLVNREGNILSPCCILLKNNFLIV